MRSENTQISDRPRLGMVNRNLAPRHAGACSPLPAIELIPNFAFTKFGIMLYK